MACERQGIHQLHQALTDYAMGAKVIRAVDGNGVLMRTEDDSQDRRVSDLYLRETFTPDGKVGRPKDVKTPEQRMQVALADLQGVIERLRMTRGLLIDVKGSDGSSVVERRGVDPRHVDGWREILNALDEDLVVWSRIWRRNYQATGVVVSPDVEDSADELSEDPDSVDALLDVWETEVEAGDYDEGEELEEELDT